MKRNLTRYIKKELFIIVMLIVISIFLAASTALGVYIWKIIYDNLFREPDKGLFVFIIVFSIALIILSNIFIILRNYLVSRLNKNLVFRIQKDFLRTIMHYKYSFFFQHNSSGFVKCAVNDCQTIATGLSQSVEGVVNLLQIIFWLIFFLFMVPWVSALYLILLGLLIGWVLIWQKKYEWSKYEITKGFDNLWRILWEVFSCIKAIKLELLKPGIMKRMDKRCTSEIKKYKAHMFYSNMVWNIFYLLPWLATGTILIGAIGEIMNGNMTIGTLVFCFLFTERFLTPLNESVTILISVQGLKTAYKRVSTYYNGENEQEGDIEFSNNFKEIQFRKVCFSYPDSHFSLHSVSLVIPRGKHVAVSGKSGTGKSTIASLLVRLFDPDSGDILIDGVLTSRYTLESLRNGIILVQQEIPIYGATLRENIDIKHTLDDNRIMDIIKKVDLLPFFDRLPSGLDTQLCGEGLDISGGERQRIGIGRALALGGYVYIFDEVTANLDKETERKIAHLLYKKLGNITTITITHNPELLTYMDIIYTIEDGKMLIN